MRTSCACFPCGNDSKSGSNGITATRVSFHALDLNRYLDSNTATVENLVLFKNIKAQLVISNARKDLFLLLSIHRLRRSKILKIKPKKTSCVVKNQIKCRFIFLSLHLLI